MTIIMNNTTGDVFNVEELINSGVNIETPFSSGPEKNKCNMFSTGLGHYCDLNDSDLLNHFTGAIQWCMNERTTPLTKKYSNAPVVLRDCINL